MFTPYRTILRQPGAFAFSSTGWVARLPMATMGLGIVLLISMATGSYGLAGSVSAAYVLLAAVGGPIQARLVDAYGQGRILPVLAVTYSVFIGAVVVSVETGLRTPWVQIFAGIAGMFSPQIGSYVRARWTRMLAGKPELQTAYALEAMLDEVVFMVGPPVVTILATEVHPLAGVLAALVCGLVGSLALAAQRRTEPSAAGRRHGDDVRPPLGWHALAPVLAAGVGLGVLFGSSEVIVVAFASERGDRSLSGLLLAGWALGSMLSALALGAIRLRSHPMTRFRIGAVGMAITMAPLPFVGNVGLLAIFLFLAGFTISPTLIASVGVVERSVPASRLTEGMAWTNSSMVAGVSLGAAVAGQVIDRYGASAGFYVPLTAGTVAAVAAIVGGHLLKARERRLGGLPNEQPAPGTTG